MTVSHYLLFLTLLIAGTLSCSTGPDFERDNKSDPKSGNYLPEIKSLKAEVNNDKTVSLSWADDSGFEDGFVIAKQLGRNNEITILDTLSTNSVNYTDKTKDLNLHTIYFVAPFKIGTVFEDSLQFTSKALDFGGFISVDYEISDINTIHVNWESDIPFADKIVLSKRTPTDSEFTPFDTLDGNKITYTYTENLPAFFVDIEIAALLQTPDEAHQTISTIDVEDISINLPSEFEAEVVDEGTIQINWTDNTPFNEQMVVYQRDAKSQYSAGEDPYTAIDTVSSLNTQESVGIDYSREIFYDFTIAPLYDETTGKKTKPVILTINTRAPEFTGIESISESELILKWKDRNYDNPNDHLYPTKQFVLERKTGDGDFEPFKTFESGQNQVKLTNLNENLNYSYRIRTLSSWYANISTSYTVNIIENHRFNINSWDSPTALRSTPLGTYFVYEYSHSGGSFGLKLLDTETGNEAEHLYFDSDFRGFSFSPDEKYVAIFQGTKPGVYDWKDSYNLPDYAYGEAESEGLFINNEELITKNHNSLSKVNVLERTNTEISAIEELKNEFPDFYIHELFPYKTKSSIFLSTNLGAFAYNFVNESMIDLNQEAYSVTDANVDGEILMVKDEEQIVMINETGEVLNEFSKPESIKDSYLDFISAKFVFNNHVVVGTTQGMLLLFNKTTGEYLSYHHISSETEKLYWDTWPIAVSADRENIMVFIHNYDGLGINFSSGEGWTTFSYEE